MRRLSIGWAAGVLLLWLPVQAQQPVGASGEDLVTVLAEMDAAGTPPTAAEVAAMSDARQGDATRGTWLGRIGVVARGRTDYNSRLACSGLRWQVKARWRQDGTGHRDASGAMAIGGRHVTLYAGQLGLPHGLGLLVGRPGRGASLTADSRLASDSGEFRLWSGAEASRTLRGLGLRGAVAGWETRALVGRNGQPGATEEWTSMIGLSRTGPHGRISLQGLRSPGETGISWAGNLRNSFLDASWEFAYRLPRGSAKGIQARLLQMGWRPRAALRLELLTGWSQVGPRPVFGRNHPVFGPGAGAGTAGRASWWLGRGLGLKFLAQKARSFRDPVSGRRSTRFVTEIQLNGHWPGGWLAGARVRAGGTDLTGWSTRFPWQAPGVVSQERRTLLSWRGGWQDARTRVRVAWRALTTGRDEGPDGRSFGDDRRLLNLDLRRELNGVWQLTFNWSVAWGGQADLVTALVPFRGYVLPRHWGHWRRERALGLAGEMGDFFCALAGSWRERAREEGEEGQPGRLAAWTQVGWRW